jgi:glycosyltransferase involved in cell wall biosynthesis
MISVTALILTRNEKENIARTLEALSWIPKILIVDSQSADDTTQIARSFPNVEVCERAFDTHANQWNAGLDRIETEWVLTLDADYVVSGELQDELKKLEPSTDVVGYWASFLYQLLGRVLRASVYPPRVVLFKVKKARYVDEGHTQVLRAEGPLLSLSGKIIHDDRKPFSQWLQAQKRYATIEARYLGTGRELSVNDDPSTVSGQPEVQLSLQDRLRKMIFFAPFAMPIYLLFVRGLILDGCPGWFYVVQRTIAEFLLSVRLFFEKLKR